MLFLMATASNAWLSWFGGHLGWGQAPGIWTSLSSQVRCRLRLVQVDSCPCMDPGTGDCMDGELGSSARCAFRLKPSVPAMAALGVGLQVHGTPQAACTGTPDTLTGRLRHTTAASAAGPSHLCSQVCQAVVFLVKIPTDCCRVCVGVWSTKQQPWSVLCLSMSFPGWIRARLTFSDSNC